MTHDARIAPEYPDANEAWRSWNGEIFVRNQEEMARQEAIRQQISRKHDLQFHFNPTKRRVSKAVAGCVPDEILDLGLLLFGHVCITIIHELRTRSCYKIRLPTRPISSPRL